MLFEIFIEVIVDLHAVVGNYVERALIFAFEVLLTSVEPAITLALWEQVSQPCSFCLDLFFA